MIIVWMVLIWRLYLFLISYFTSVYYSFSPSFPYSDVYLMPSGLPKFIWTWANFDGVHYISIAWGGYFAQFTQAFFPFYSLLIRQLGGNTLAGLIISGISISTISIIGAQIVFRKLLLLDYPKSTAVWSCMFLLLFPTSFYFGALYTESLFLFLVLSSFLFARGKSWWLCGIFGALASATRITGILLLPALLWEYFSSYRIGKINKRTSLFNRVINYSLLTLHSPILYLIPLGLVSYMFYLQLNFHDALYFWHAQSVFGAERTGSTIVFPFQVVWRYFKILTSISYTQVKFWIAFWELGSLIAATYGLSVAHKLRLRKSYLIFGWSTLLLPILTGTLSSLPRYLLPIFPLYIIMASLRNSRLKLVLLFLCSLFQLWLTSRFIQGLWVA